MRRRAAVRMGIGRPARRAWTSIALASWMFVGGGGSPDGLYKKFVEYAGGESKACIAIFPTGQGAGENAHTDAVDQLDQQIGDRLAVIQDIPPLNLSQAQSEVQAVRRCRHLSFSPFRM